MASPACRQNCSTVREGGHRAESQRMRRQHHDDGLAAEQHHDGQLPIIKMMYKYRGVCVGLVLPFIFLTCARCSILSLKAPSAGSSFHDTSADIETAAVSRERKNVLGKIYDIVHAASLTSHVISAARGSTSIGASRSTLTFERSTSAKEIFLDILSTIPNVYDGTRTAIEKHFPIPEGTSLTRNEDDDCIILNLPNTHRSPRVSINPDAPLPIDEFAVLNRHVGHDNLQHLPDKRIPDPTAVPEKPRIKDLKYFRSIGPKVTKELVSGSELTAGGDIVIRIRDNTIEFIEGAPQIGSTRIAAIEFRALHQSLNREQGRIKVYTKTGYLPLLSDEYFVSDIATLLPKMQPVS